MKPIHVVIAAAVAYLVYRKRRGALGDPPFNVLPPTSAPGTEPDYTPWTVYAPTAPKPAVKSYYQSRVMLPAPKIPGGLPAAVVVDLPDYAPPTDLRSKKDIALSMSAAGAALQKALEGKPRTAMQPASPGIRYAVFPPAPETESVLGILAKKAGQALKAGIGPYIPSEERRKPVPLDIYAGQPALPEGSYSEANAVGQAKREAAALKKSRETLPADYSGVKIFNEEEWKAEDAAYRAAQLQAQIAYQYASPTLAPVALPIPEERPAERVVLQPFVQAKTLEQRQADASKAQADWAGEQARLERVKKASDAKWLAEERKKIANEQALERSRQIVAEEKLRREYEKKESDAKRPGIVKTREAMSPEEQELYFTNKRLWELDKDEYVKANYANREYDEVIQAAVGYYKTDKKTGKRVFVPSSSGTYQEEAVPELQQKLIDNVAAKYDRMNKKTAPDGKPLKFGVPFVSDEVMKEQVVNATLDKMSKGGTFITSLNPYLNKRGEMTKEGIDAQMFGWAKSMLEVGKENMSPSELAMYVKQFVGDAVKRQAESSLIKAYLRATDTQISNEERKQLAYDLAKVQNATTYEIANELTPAGMAKAGPIKLLKDIASRIGEKEVAQAKKGINDYLSGKAREYAFGTEATARGLLASKVISDPSKSQAQKTSDLVAMGWISPEVATPGNVSNPSFWASVKGETSKALTQSNNATEQIAREVAGYKQKIRDQFTKQALTRKTTSGPAVQYGVDGIDDIAAMEFGRNRRSRT